MGSKRRVLLAILMGFVALGGLVWEVDRTDSRLCVRAAEMADSGYLEMAQQTYARLEPGRRCPGDALDKVAVGKGDAVALVSIAKALERAGWPEAARSAYLDALDVDRGLRDAERSATATTTSTTTSTTTPATTTPATTTVASADVACAAAARLEQAGLPGPALEAYADILAGGTQPTYQARSDQQRWQLSDPTRSCAASGAVAVALRLGQGERLYQRGRAYRTAGRDEEARKALTKALQEDPGHADARQVLDALLPQNGSTTSLARALPWVLGGLVIVWLLLQITARLMRNLLRPARWLSWVVGAVLLGGTGYALYRFGRIGAGGGSPPTVNWRGSAPEAGLATAAALLGWVLASRLLLSPPRIDVAPPEQKEKEDSKDAKGVPEAAKDAKDDTKATKATTPVPAAGTAAGLQSKLQLLTSSHSSSIGLVSGPDQNLTVPEISVVPYINPVLKVLGALAPYRLVPPMRLMADPNPKGDELTLRLVDGNRVIGVVTLSDKEFGRRDLDVPGRYLYDAAAVWTTYTVKQLSKPKWRLMGTEDWRSFALGYVGSLIQDDTDTPACAKRLYVAALSRDPNNRQARYNLARAFLADEEEDQAVPHLERVRQNTEPRRTLAFENLLWARTTYSLAAARYHQYLKSTATTATLYAPELSPSFWMAPRRAFSVDVEARPATEKEPSNLRVDLGSGPTAVWGGSWQRSPMAFLEPRPGGRHRYVGHIDVRTNDRFVQTRCQLDGVQKKFYGDLDPAPAAGDAGSATGSGTAAEPARPPDWVKLLVPRRIHYYLGTTRATPAITAQVHILGVTDQPEPARHLQVELGYGPDVGSREQWTWSPMWYLDHGGWGPGHDERFVGWFRPTDAGSFVYLARARTADDADWVYADLDGSGDRRTQSQLNQPGNLVVSPAEPENQHLAEAERKARSLVRFVLKEKAWRFRIDWLRSVWANVRIRSQRLERMRTLDDLEGIGVLLLAGIWAAKENTRVGDAAHFEHLPTNRSRARVAWQLWTNTDFKSQCVVDWAEAKGILASPRVQYNLACYYTQLGQNHWTKALAALRSAMEDASLAPAACKDVSLRPLREGTDEFDPILAEARSRSHTTDQTAPPSRG